MDEISTGKPLSTGQGKAAPMTLHTEQAIDNAVSAEKSHGLDPEIVKRIK